MDTHPMGQITEEQLRHLQTAPKDEFGITHHDILFNAEEDRPGLLRARRPRSGLGAEAPPARRYRVRVGPRGQVHAAGLPLGGRTGERPSPDLPCLYR
jgi:hypothetical protein